MAFDPSPTGDQTAPSGRARAANADADVDRRLRLAIGDLFLPDAARLPERVRARVHYLLENVVAVAEAELRRHAARLLAARGAVRSAEGLLGGPPVLARLADAGLLRDPDLVEELIARVELDLLFDALPPAVLAPDRPSLLVRWTDSPDSVVAAAALALLAADNHRRAANEGLGPVGSELPAELHQRLIWWIAAAIREQGADPDGMADRDRALADATLRSLAAHDESSRPEAVAERLASAVDAQPGELAPLLVEAASDRRGVLFTGLLARAADVDQDQVRRLVTDPQGCLLTLLLHAVGVDRDRIARIGVAFAAADPRRDLERLADAIDWAVAHDPAQARAALAPLALGRDFRAAVRLLERGA